MNLLLTLCSAVVLSSSGPFTTPELTNYTKTSSFADVVWFLKQIQKPGAPFRQSELAKSAQGRSVPLIICHKDPNITPEEARARNLPVIYIQANIHAGEVEGKEAALMFLRDWSQNPAHPFLKDMVHVVAPIYNTDGNEAWGPCKTNRPHQDGPEPVGQRANGQGLDLNRDCMKAASPEMQGVLKEVYEKWNPDVVFDLHTTNGTRHGYMLTYSPALNPTGDPDVLHYNRDVLLPGVRKVVESRTGWKLQDYGNVETRDGKQVYASFECFPRYVTNYAGIRNRIAILSEAASFQPFKLRIESTKAFVQACLERIHRDRKLIVKLTRQADERWRSGMTTQKADYRYKMKSRGVEPLILEVDRPPAEIDYQKAPTKFRTVSMPVWDRFETVYSFEVPTGYLIKASETEAIRLLKLHGIKVEEIKVPWLASVHNLAVGKVTKAQNPFQGRRLTSIQFLVNNAMEMMVPIGDFYVSTRQPLGLLACHLLDPHSSDGFITWEVIPVEEGKIFSVWFTR